MCNLSQGIKEQAYVESTENGIAIGKQEGITIGKREGIAETIIKMYRKGYEAEQISDILEKNSMVKSKPENGLLFLYQLN